MDSLAFTDAETLARRTLGDPDLRGKPRIIQVFGSWCPNCLDETRYLAELHARYSERGLTIVGVAFELSGNSRKDVIQLARWRARVAVPYPILYGGIADKPKATVTFGGLDRIRAFPTTIFVDREGNVVAVHTGFAGPATGAAHERLRTRFEELVERILREGTERRGSEASGGPDADPEARREGERR